MSIENFGSITAAVSGGFLGGILLGYALRKVIRIAAIVVGLFIAGLVYLQYQQVASFDWNRIEGLFSSILHNFTNQISNTQYATFVIPDLGIPLTSSMSIGFTLGFMKG
jgi:uncharacterized membrane protein (Fun14 family)